MRKVGIGVRLMEEELLLKLSVVLFPLFTIPNR